MAMAPADLEDLLTSLARRPGHDSVRVQLGQLLTTHLEAHPADIDQEKWIETRSRVDTLLGRTVFEIKRDLRVEGNDARSQLERYLRQREAHTGETYCGVATDGRDFRAYELRDGSLTLLSTAQADPADPHALPAWLEGIVALQPHRPADSLTVLNELGRNSVAFQRAAGVLATVWQRCHTTPEACLKRDLWNNHLQVVYGASQDDDTLWFQHTYLVVVAKAFAHALLGLAPADAKDLLTGASLQRAEIQGAIESDFFDWVLAEPEGADLVGRIYARVLRFRLSEAGTDLLKVLYESLIDPQQRHDLGEYYTPDWLAQKIVRAHIDQPLTQKVLDPSCGSGTFLFHAVRHLRISAEAAGYGASDILALCLGQIRGIDIHPVAIIIARVTYLLALTPAVLGGRQGAITLPVYLGDAMQWDVRTFFEDKEVVLHVPPANADDQPKALKFPQNTVEQPQRFESGLRLLVECSAGDWSSARTRARLFQEARIRDADLDVFMETYDVLRTLHRQGRNHIWTFVARNMSRPFWLSRQEPADRLIGNPPWLSFRYMQNAMKQRVREGMRGYHIWVGGRLATQQDLAGYFYARCADLYLRREGKIAFLMPLATLTRGQYAKFRTGQINQAALAFEQAWTFDERLYEVFKVPSCALFARRTALGGTVPDRVTAFVGILPYRNADEGEADRRLRRAEESRPGEASFTHATPYRQAFRNGATLFPRMLVYVTRESMGLLGTGTRVRVRSRRSAQEKEPWSRLSDLRGSVESRFLMPALLGESIGPYRVLDWPEAVIPFSGEMVSASAAVEQGWPGLSEWLSQAEETWSVHGKSTMTFGEQINYYNKLGKQLAAGRPVVVYAKAGTRPTAAVVHDSTCIFDHKLYWCFPDDPDACYYLSAILNSEVTRKSVEHLQSRGQWGRRDFDKVMFTLPIPRYASSTALHTDLAQAARAAEQVAAQVPLTRDDPATGDPRPVSATRARRDIRNALAEQGLDRRIDDLVSRLLFNEPISRA